MFYKTKTNPNKSELFWLIIKRTFQVQQVRYSAFTEFYSVRLFLIAAYLLFNS